MCRTLEVYNMWNQSKIFPVVRATLAITIDKVPATHVASPKLPYPPPGGNTCLTVHRSPKPSGKQSVKKSTNTPRVSVNSDG